MNRLARFLGIISIFMFFTAGSSFSAKFDPLFRIVNIKGVCNVKTPNSDKYVPAVSQKAYPYGTAIKTGARSSIIILLSDGNECQVLANADLVLTESPKDAKLKILNLNYGTVNVSLEHNFSDNNGFDIETPTAICGAISCEYKVKVDLGKEINVAAFQCKEGNINVRGHEFKFELPEGTLLSAAGSLDRMHKRFKVVRGPISVHVKDSDGAPKILSLPQDAEFQIWLKRASVEGKIAVVTVVSNPDGSIMHSFNYTTDDKMSKEDYEKLDKLIKEEKQKEKEQNKTSKENGNEELKPVVTTTTTTTTSTTTTSIPSVTPVGRR